MRLCDVCGFDLWLPVAELQISVLGLYDDARFPGRCILAYRHHLEDLSELSDADALVFLADLRRASRAILAVVNADRVNYAFLGNSISHLHAHLIPRRYAHDPIPTKAPWAHPETSTQLPVSERHRIMEGIKDILRTPS